MDRADLKLVTELIDAKLSELEAKLKAPPKAKAPAPAAPEAKEPEVKEVPAPATPAPKRRH